MANRDRVIEISKLHKLSHIGSCLTALPIIEEIYARKLPQDRFVLSAGHSHLAHLVVMESEGLINAEENVEKYGIHCDRRAGCDVSTGSLGTGLPIAVGMALADRTKDIYCLVSDGELSEGSCWEALRVAEEQKLGNLILIMNANGYGAYGKVDTQKLLKQLDSFIPGGMVIEENSSSFEKAMAFSKRRDGPSWMLYKTNSDIGTWAVGLQSHYKAADEELK